MFSLGLTWLPAISYEEVNFREGFIRAPLLSALTDNERTAVFDPPHHSREDSCSAESPALGSVQNCLTQLSLDSTGLLLMTCSTLSLKTDTATCAPARLAINSSKSLSPCISAPFFRLLVNINSPCMMQHDRRIGKEQ